MNIYGEVGSIYGTFENFRGSGRSYGAIKNASKYFRAPVNIFGAPFNIYGEHFTLTGSVS